MELADFQRFARLLAFKYRPFDGGGDGQDVFQEAMIAAWRALRDWNGNGDVESYVKLKMKRRALDYVRVRSHGKTVELPEIVSLEDWEAHGPDTTVERVLERERLQTLVNAARGLSRWQRARLVNRIDGLSNEEIAVSEGRTLAAIEMSFWKTRKTLKLALAA